MPLSNEQIQRAEGLCHLLESIQRVLASAVGEVQHKNLKSAADAVSIEIKSALPVVGGET
ncbi:hypothetical protein D3C77_174780 [compost metagenome]